jgi:hypothetical protein
VVVLWIDVPAEFSLLYATRSSLDLAFKQCSRNRHLRCGSLPKTPSCQMIALMPLNRSHGVRV